MSKKNVQMFGIFIIILSISFGVYKSSVATKKKIVDTGERTEFFLRSEKDVENILNDGRPSFIFFGSKTCSACIGTKRDAEILYKENTPVSIGYIEVTENPELLELYKIQQTPSILIFDEEGDPYKFRRKYKKELDIFYKKDENNKVEYSVFLGIPKIKRLKRAIEILS